MQIQFDPVYRYLFQHVQGGITTAEIIHLHLEAH